MKARNKEEPSQEDQEGEIRRRTRPADEDPALEEGQQWRWHEECSQRTG
jgi:hypothetical protein